MAEQVVRDKYKVLHIPTASYIVTYNRTTNSFEIVIFDNKARAGHAIDDYRKQRFNNRSYSGYGLFLEADVRNFDMRRNNLYQLTDMIRRSINEHGEFHKAEFEFIKVEDNALETKTS